MAPWVRAPVPVDEPDRLRRLSRLGIREGQPHEVLDNLTALASTVLGVPIALVSLVEDDRQVFLSRFGLAEHGTGRSESFCGHAVVDNLPMSVPDSHEDVRFAANPLVVGAVDVRAYLGVPLLGGLGQSAIGTLCVVDHEPRQWTREEQATLARIASLVEHYIEGLAFRRAWLDSPLSLVIVERGGRCVRVNPAFGALTGRATGMLLGRELSSFLLPADRGLASAMIAHTLGRPDSPTRRELRLVRLSGEVVSAGMSVSRVHDVDDQVICVLRDISLERSGAAHSRVVAEVRGELAEPIADARAMVQSLKAHGTDDELAVIEKLDERLELLAGLLDARMGDIAARVRAEDELLASQLQLRAVVEHVVGPMIVLDDRGTIVDANARAVAELGWEYGVLIGSSMRAVYPDFTDGLLQRWFSASANRLAESSELAFESAVFRRKDGSDLRVEVRSLVMSWNGPQRLVLLASDVTRAHARETRLLHERDELEDRVRLRNEALSERERMELDLKRSLSEKETLLKEIHHRVKNNLQIVSSLLTLQMEHVPEGTSRALLAESVQRVRSMALIHQHLYGSTSLERIELATYARDLGESLRFALAPSARLQIDANSALVTVEHAVPVGLILNELVTNAFKYGLVPANRADVGYDVLVQIAKRGGEIHLSVRDRGPGLPDEFSVDRTSSLGLQLVRSLTRQVKGKLTARTDEGAVFSVAFAV
jgi:PAS domain S-box-containing protein